MYRELLFLLIVVMLSSCTKEHTLNTLVAQGEVPPWVADGSVPYTGKVQDVEAHENKGVNMKWRDVMPSFTRRYDLPHIVAVFPYEETKQ